MHFLLSSTIALLAAASTSTAQTINPDSVSNATRQQWCTTQTSSCPLICATVANGNTGTVSNTCDWQTLDYSCVCSNNISPNASQYTQTIPYYECTEAATQCASACGNNDASCVTNCRTAHPCGAQDPYMGNGTSASTSSSASGTAGATGSSSGGSGGSQTFSGFAGATASSTPGNSAASRRFALPRYVDAGVSGFFVAAGLALGAAVVL